MLQQLKLYNESCLKVNGYHRFEWVGIDRFFQVRTLTEYPREIQFSNHWDLYALKAPMDNLLCQINIIIHLNLF